MSSQPPSPEKSEDSSRGKIIWAACEDFDTPSAKKSVKTILEEADTPNIDRLCHFSESGLLEAGPSFANMSEQTVGEVVGMRSIAITNLAEKNPLEGIVRFERYERVKRLSEFEEVLAGFWEDHDLFYIHLDGKAHVEWESGEPSDREWVEMIDAWIPGFMARFQPKVFALTGDVSTTLKEESAAVPAMVHSKRSHSRRKKGFNHRDCQGGQLGEHFDLSRWFVLLREHAGYLDGR